MKLRFNYFLFLVSFHNSVRNVVNCCVLDFFQEIYRWKALDWKVNEIIWTITPCPNPTVHKKLVNVSVMSCIKTDKNEILFHKEWYCLKNRVMRIKKSTETPRHNTTFTRYRSLFPWLHVHWCKKSKRGLH